jgi:hypothetical protein
MPFGKYRGIDLRHLPGSYLAWLRDELELREPLFSAIERECDRRAGQPRSSEAPQVILRLEAAELPLVKQVFDLGYKSAARSLHPDAGGTSQAMQRLNALVASVREQLDQLEAR